MKSFASLLSFGSIMLSLTLCSCNEQKESITTSGETSVSTNQESKVSSSDQDSADIEAKIAFLEKGIATRKQTIQDLEAAVLMEQAKVEDNPDYDTTFLLEIKQEQDTYRHEIEEAEKQLEALSPQT